MANDKNRATSYFRIGTGFRAAYVFFDDESGGDTDRAWGEVKGLARAMRNCSIAVAVWRPTLFAGEWDYEAQVVGFRTPNAIDVDQHLGLIDREEEKRRLVEAFAARRRGGVARFASPS